MKRARVMILLALALVASAARAADDPFRRFHVFSLADIGSTESPYHSDFQGVAAAAGSAVFFGMSLCDLGLPQSDVSFYAGGDLTFTGSIRNGGIEVAGNVALLGVSIEGDVSCGGDVYGNGGTVEGDIEAEGAVSLTALTVTGSATPGSSFLPTEDLVAASDFFLERSAHYGALPATDEPTVGGQVLFDAGPGVHVFRVDAAAVDAAWGVAVHAPAGATVIVNVLGTSAALTDMDWQVTGGVGLDKVLVNFPDATSLDIHGVAVFGNILAPRAALLFPAGLVVGGLWVGDLQGGGQVNYGTFTEPDDETTSTRATSWSDIKKSFR